MKMCDDLARITSKVEDKDFNILSFPRIKCIRDGEYMDIIAMKNPRKKRTPEQKERIRKKREKLEKQRLKEEEERAKEEKMKIEDYAHWEIRYGWRHTKRKPIEKKKKKSLEEETETDYWKMRVKEERMFANLRSSANALYKFIHANFYMYQGLHVTLTYSVPQYDDKEVYHDFKIFWQKFKYYYPDIGYISVLEPHRSGAWHIHLLLKDVTNKEIFVSYKDIRSYWNHGFCYISKMKSNEDYGWYFKKKIKADNPLLKYYKENVRYFRYSKNMSKPDVLIVENPADLDLQALINSNFKKINQFSISLYLDKAYEPKKKQIAQIYYVRYMLKSEWQRKEALRFKHKSYRRMCARMEKRNYESEEK